MTLTINQVTRLEDERNRRLDLSKYSDDHLIHMKTYTYNDENYPLYEVEKEIIKGYMTRLASLVKQSDIEGINNTYKELLEVFEEFKKMHLEDIEKFEKVRIKACHRAMKRIDELFIYGGYSPRYYDEYKDDIEDDEEVSA